MSTADAATPEFSFVFKDAAGFTKTIHNLDEALVLFQSEERAWERSYGEAENQARSWHPHGVAKNIVQLFEAPPSPAWWNAINKRMERLNGANQQMARSFFSCTDAADCFAICQKRNSAAASSFISFLAGDQFYAAHEPNTFFGAALATRFLTNSGIPWGMEFGKQVQSQFLEIRQTEEKALAEAKSIRDDLESWQKATEGDHNKWVDESRKAYSVLVEEVRQKQDHLLAAFTDHMHLEGPSRYWKKRAAELRYQGMWWTLGLSVTAVLSLAFFGYLLWMWAIGLPPHSDWLSLQHAKGIVLNVISISVLVFLLRTFSRMAFSCFHLQRDAEEKRQLTEFYLSLLRRGGVDPKERGMVLQALFSRADSGLLTGDHSPTMPGPLKDLGLGGGKSS